MKFKRVQRSRKKGSVTPPNTKYVGRPTQWANPFSVEEYGREEAIKKYRVYFAEKIERKELSIEELRGKNLSCWCGLDKACHVDVIFEEINKTAKK